MRCFAANEPRRGEVVHAKIAFEGGSAEELNNNELVRKFYFGL